MIRRSKLSDLEEMERIYSHAREFMRQTGNPNQWGDNKPERELLESDIATGNSYVMEDENGVYATFAFFLGEDVTYGYIEGNWLNSEPYGTIHRIASDGRKGNILKEAVDFAFSQTDNVRIDTHEDNKVMQKAITKNGFTYCGTIYLLDGDPRRAYHKIKE